MENSIENLFIRHIRDPCILELYAEWLVKNRVEEGLSLQLLLKLYREGYKPTFAGFCFDGLRAYEGLGDYTIDPPFYIPKCIKLIPDY